MHRIIACAVLALGMVVSIAPSAPVHARQAGETIEVWDMTAPGERRRVTPDWTRIEAAPLGSKANPIRAFMPLGQRAYIARLRCRDGSPPTGARRVGNVGPGPYETIVDLYEVVCREGTTRLHLDMYHPGHAEERAPPGFAIAPP